MMDTRPRPVDEVDRTFAEILFVDLPELADRVDDLRLFDPEE